MTIDRYLSDLFRRNFLESHYENIKAVSKLINREYDTNYHSEKFADYIYIDKLDRMQLSRVGVFSFQSKCFRNLRNLWYNEISFKHKDQEGDTLFPAWKIVQFYYAVYAGISALVRSFDQKIFGHGKMLKYFSTNILYNKKLREGIVYPFNVHLDQNGLIKDPSLSERKVVLVDDDFFPQFVKTLKSVEPGSSGRIISIFDYFKKLREWASYEEPYLFFRIYSANLRHHFQKYLSQIIDPFIFMIEAFLIKLHGFVRINDQKEIFVNNLEESIGIPANDISDRFFLHRQYKT